MDIFDYVNIKTLCVTNDAINKAGSSGGAGKRFVTHTIVTSAVEERPARWAPWSALPSHVRPGLTLRSRDGKDEGDSGSGDLQVSQWRHNQLNGLAEVTQLVRGGVLSDPWPPAPEPVLSITSEQFSQRPMDAI